MKYRKLPVVIEAFKWTGDIEQTEDPEWIIEAIKNKVVTIGTHPVIENYPLTMHIKTLEGTMNAKQGDYIIKDINGELYPCKPDIFEKTYELVLWGGNYEYL